MGSVRCEVDYTARNRIEMGGLRVRGNDPSGPIKTRKIFVDC
jgi:hypothetical protein